MNKINFFLISTFLLNIASLQANEEQLLRLASSAPQVENKVDADEALARQSQNPVADLISIPFQNNTNFDVGARDKTQNILNIQPVIPINLNEDWNLITRTIVPLISQSALFDGWEKEQGIGDITFTAFFSPRNNSEWVWGAGPAIVMPTASDSRLGTDKWSIGPSVVALRMDGKQVYGGLVSNVWSIEGSGENVNLMTFQPFYNYNFDAGFYFTSSPVLNANWENDGEKWTVPVGGGLGKIFRIGQLPVNVSLQAFTNIVKPDHAADWTLRFQVQLLFPK
ncbi:MAG: hypothetical protein NE330_10820 [Lentisphaeraceae bacterium]|nr:hypothetical protein [Lentisphaeraceae bacterium]